MSEGCRSLRWVVDDASAGAVRRPDDAWLVELPHERPDAWPMLLDRAVDGIRGRLLVHTGTDDPAAGAVLTAAGFRPIRTECTWFIPLPAIAPVPIRATAHELVPVDECDPQLVTSLDNTIRADIPGTAHWSGTVTDLVESLADDEFDRSLYLIARHRTTDSHDGLIRVWARTPHPRIGCVGVRRRWRRSRLPAALMSAVVTELVRRGVVGVTTETDTLNRGSHRLAARRGTETGRITEWERPVQPRLTR